MSGFGALPGRRGALALLAGAPLVLAGCGQLAPLPPRDPRLEFSALRLGGAGADGVRVAFFVDCENPNDFDVPASSLRFDVELLGAPFASGTALDAPITLPARGRQRIPVEATLPLSNLRELARRVRPENLASAEYRIRGSVRWGALGLAIPFDRSGTVSLIGALLGGRG